VKEVAATQSLQIAQPVSLRDARSQSELERFRADVIVVVAYGLILPQPMLEFSRYGAINIHASLLPRWRGAAPIQRALLAGDRDTGVSIMQMDSGLDTGPVLMQEKIPILEDDTAGTLHDRLAELGAKLIVRALDAIEAVGSGRRRTGRGGDLCSQARQREARVDWRENALAVNRRVRALNPSPGADARTRGVGLKIWRCAALADGGAG